MTRKRWSWWWLLLPLLFVSYQKIDVITKGMIRVTQTARDFVDPAMALSIQEIREQQAAFARDVAALAETMRDLRQQVEERTKHNLTVTDSLEKAVSETQEKMVLAGEISSVLEKRLNDV